MPLSADSVEITQAVIDKIEAGTFSPALTQVRYGVQQLEPTYPAAFVTSGPKTRGFLNTREFDIGFTVFVTVVFGKVQSSEVNQKQAEQLVEDIEAHLHTDFKLGDRVFFGYVNRTEPGVVLKESVMLRSARLTWIASSAEQF